MEVVYLSSIENHDFMSKLSLFHGRDPLILCSSYVRPSSFLVRREGSSSYKDSHLLFRPPTHLTRALTHTPSQPPFIIIGITPYAIKLNWMSYSFPVSEAVVLGLYKKCLHHGGQNVRPGHEQLIGEELLGKILINTSESRPGEGLSANINIETTLYEKRPWLTWYSISFIVKLDTRIHLFVRGH